MQSMRLCNLNLDFTTSHYIHNMDVGSSLQGFGGPTNIENNKKKIHQNAFS